MTSHCTEESLETNRIVSSEILRYVDVFSMSHNYLCCQILKSSSQVLLMYDCGMFTRRLCCPPRPCGCLR